MPISQIVTNSIANDAVVTADIANGAVTNAKIDTMAASKLTGQVARANAPSGSVIQVVESILSVPVSTTSTSWVTTGLSATITPISISSRIAAFLSTTLDTQNAGVQAGITLFRNSTNLEIEGITSQYSPTVRLNSASSFVWVDYPSTTSATTYSVRYAVTFSSGTIFFNQGTGIGNSTATLILMEIAP
jgi:hypothetical protein